MNTEKTSLENESQPSCLGAVSCSPSFKELLINDFIPRIELMEEKERQHLYYLIEIKAPLDFINRSQETQLHLVAKIKEYKEYVERL